MVVVSTRYKPNLREGVREKTRHHPESFMKNRTPNVPTALALFLILNFQPLVARAAPIVTAVAAGLQHTLFIKSDGSLWAMGRNSEGQLGDGTGIDRHVPI